MPSIIKEHKMGKLRIYLVADETVKGDKLLHKTFPKNKYKKILDEAKKAGIMNAHVYHIHTDSDGVNNVLRHSTEGKVPGSAVCLELVDKKENLVSFFTKHKAILQNKTVVFSEVEFWSFDA